MKKNYYSSLIFLVMAFLLISHANAQGNAQLSGSAITIQKEEMGYNCQNYFGGPKWSDPDFRHTATRLRPGNLRYPGGTIANYWDWRTGTIIPEKTSGFPNYRGTEFAYTPRDFVEGMPEGTEIVYVVNMARPTEATGVSINAPVDTLESRNTLDKKIVDILAAIQEFSDAGHPLKYIELGNEFYNGANGAPGASGAIYSGRVELYIEHVNILADSINEKFPNAKLAVIGDALDESAGTTNVASTWTNAIYTAIEQNRLKNIDAITFHWYTGPGVPTLTTNNLVEKSLSRPFIKQRTVTQSDFGTNRLGLDLWITEYNTFSQPGNSTNPNNPGNGGAIQGSWTNGLFGADLTLLYTMLGSKVKMLDVHALTLNNSQWAMLKDQNVLSGNGVAQSMVGKAMMDMTSARNITFPGITNPTFGTGNNPSLYGVKFSNGVKESMVVINNTRNAKIGVNISSIFTGSADRHKTLYYDTTPFIADSTNPSASLVTENQGLDYGYEDNTDNIMNFPPFSITVVEQEKSNLIANSSFETDSNWSNINHIESNIENASTGKKVLKLTTTSQGYNGSSQTVTIAPNSNYTINSKIRTQLTKGGSRILLKFYNSSNAAVGSNVASELITGTESYRDLKVNFISPANATRVEITLQLANGLGTVWFDDVVLRSNSTTSNSSKTLKSEVINNINSGFMIYPNPVKNGTFQVKLGGNSVVPNTIEVVNMVGKTILLLKNPKSSNVEVEGLSSGMYIVNADYEGVKYSKKLMIN